MMISGKPISKELVQQIREEVLKGKSKHQVSREMNITDTVVYKYTKDLPNRYKRDPYISGKPLELLKQLLEKGYVYTEENRNALRALQRYFPQIKRSQFKGKSCYYLEDKNKLALLEMMKQDTSRIISYQELGRMTKVFNTSIEIEQKKAFLGRKRARSPWKIKESTNRYGSISKEKQTKIDDFLGRFLHSEVLNLVLSHNRVMNLPS